MMSSSKTNNRERCIRCNKTFLTARIGLKCTKCACFSTRDALEKLDKNILNISKVYLNNYNN